MALQKMEKFNTCLPTGFATIDMMLGENMRDLEGNLIDIQRGWQVTGKQYAIAGIPGAGKSSWLAEALAFPLHIGMADCIDKIIIIDTDNGAWTNNRIRKLTNLSIDLIEKKIKIIHESDVDSIVKELTKESEAYLKKKHKPVTFFDYYMGCERKMLPSVIIAVDTVTSLTSSTYEKDMLAKQQSLTAFMDVSNLANNVSKLFDGNNATIWCAHLKPNTPKIGQTIADKEFKSAPANLKSHVPLRIKQKLSSFIWLTKNQDGANQESKSHPIQMYGLQDMNTKSCYITNGISVKSRTGTEGRTIGKLFFINGKFDRTMSLISSAMNMGVLEDVGGRHPSVGNGDFSVFSDKPGCEAEQEAQGRRAKSALRLNGYHRKTNVIEARLLMNYVGPNEEVIEERDKFTTALLSELEEYLAYELEVNNVSTDELKTNQMKIQSLLGHIGASMNRSSKKFKKKELDEKTPDDKREEYI